MKYFISCYCLSKVSIRLYRYSQTKNFRNRRTIFKIAVIISGIQSGIIPSNTQAMEPYYNNSSSSIERPISSSKSGAGARAKADSRRNNLRKKISKSESSSTKFPTSGENRRRLLGVFSNSRPNTGMRGNQHNPIIDVLEANRPSKATQIHMVKSDGLEESGLSKNHNEFSEEIQQIEKRTSERRAHPIRQSKTDPKKYYAENQGVKKGKKHLPDFEINLETMSDNEIAKKVYEISENVLQDLKTDTYFGTLNLAEDVVIELNQLSRTLAIYEDHPIYSGEYQHHITTYKATQKAIDKMNQSINGTDILNEDCNPALTTIKNADGLTSKTRGPNIGEPIKVKQAKILAEQEKLIQQQVA